MTETPATAPVFPPGRYGRRRAPRTARRWLLPALVALVALAGVGVGWRMYTQFGDPVYDAEVIRYTGITDTSVTVDFRVTVPPGGSAECGLRARSYDGADVGRTRVVVTAEPGERRAVARHVVPTTARPFIGEVVACRAAG
ncbi:DUF4307 domain-containing protein [Spirilliplanes yamanashiensis]|uniref:DUF4307 domain-containing protein n=1 Tax=Spirilliplanes yamanashiensis TaxID=42233 RepID=A0A8J4DKI3_9ACTN|nr:DUF4307 domain-containing protein [Spirilliplanes yamanashiensis]MDP9816073.1 hypothetical protein [Spirilliplanes yamanashiensis]GIJ04333.1 hypothetical protein Sya03_36850 [Spirilliplanes yamanashiensis]